jgi:hypothetical protein
MRKTVLKGGLMKDIWRIILVLIVIYAPCCFASEVSSRNIEIISNILKYKRGNDSTSFRIAAIYDPASESSKNEANDFVNEINRSVGSKNPPIQATAVSVNDLSGKSEFNVGYITKGLSAHYGEIQDFAKKHKVLTVSLDSACTAKDCCIISIKEGSTVDIYLNERTLASYGLEVDATFKFMVKKV